ncbi:MAG: T9SS type A sorting domain-containing protein [Hymenobacteraceae bacterium]|nr:T9SS type A sorting domain-containing protein [Hymenobacteraceae bacterium]
MKKTLLSIGFCIVLGLSTQAQSVGERATAEERSIVLFPNPSAGILHVTATGFEGTANLRVLNVIGNEVYRETLSGSEPRISRTIDLSSLSAGLYYVKIESGPHAEMRKVVIR